MYLVKTVIEKFSKTLPRVEIFEKSCFRIFVWTVKRELFEKDDVIVSDLSPDKNVSLLPCPF